MGMWVCGHVGMWVCTYVCMYEATEVGVVRSALVNTFPLLTKLLAVRI